MELKKEKEKKKFSRYTEPSTWKLLKIFIKER